VPLSDKARATPESRGHVHYNRHKCPPARSHHILHLSLDIAFVQLMFFFRIEDHGNTTEASLEIMMRADPCSKQVNDFISSLPCLSTHRTLRFLVGGPFPEEQATRVRTGELCRASAGLVSDDSGCQYHHLKWFRPPLGLIATEGTVSNWVSLVSLVRSSIEFAFGARLLRSSPARSWSARPQRRVVLAEARVVPAGSACKDESSCVSFASLAFGEGVVFGVRAGRCRLFRAGVGVCTGWSSSPSLSVSPCEGARRGELVLETGSGSACFSSTTSPAKPGGGLVRSRPLSGSGCGIGNPTATLPMAPSLPRCTESA